MSSDSELADLFSWFQGVPGSYEKFENLTKSNSPAEIIKNIGVSLGIQDDKWKDMTHKQRLLAIYEQLPDDDDEKLEFKQAFPALFQKEDYRLRRLMGAIEDALGGDKRNKSKKPKRRNSRSKRRNSRSKRRKTVSKRRR
jgi:hypothetical protein